MNGRDAASLAVFKEGYLDFYPYLLNQVLLGDMRGMRVLEIGLGYGTLGQKIAEAGADYHGLDVSSGPVNMMNHRLRMIGREPTAIQASILQCPYADATFDGLVSIGCFHHTGDLLRSVEQARRVLKPGGWASIMVYNRYSYRNWLRWPGPTWQSLRTGRSRPSTTAQRAAFDASASGQGTPETAFLAVGELQSLFSGFSSFRAVKRNWGGIGIKGVTLVRRRPLLGLIGPLCGLDIYVSAVK